MTTEFKSTAEERKSESEIGGEYQFPVLRHLKQRVSGTQICQAAIKAGFSLEFFSSHFPDWQNTETRYNGEMLDGMNVLAESNLSELQKKTIFKSMRVNPTHSDVIAKLYVVLCSRGKDWQQFEQRSKNFLLKYKDSGAYAPSFLGDTVGLLKKFDTFSPSEKVWEHYLDCIFSESLKCLLHHQGDLEEFLYRMGLLNETNIQVLKRNYLEIRTAVFIFKKEIESSTPEQKQLYLDLCLIFPAVAPQIAELYTFLKEKNQIEKIGSDLSRIVEWFRGIVEAGLIVHMLQICKQLNEFKCCSQANMDIILRAVSDPAQSGRLLMASKMLSLSLIQKASAQNIQQVFDRIMTAASAPIPSAASPSSQIKEETKGDSKTAIPVQTDEKQNPATAIVARSLIDEIKSSRPKNGLLQLKQAQLDMPDGVLGIIQEYSGIYTVEDEQNQLQAEKFFMAGDVLAMQGIMKKAVESGWVSTLEYCRRNIYLAKMHPDRKSYENMNLYLKLAIQRNQFEATRLLLESVDFNSHHYSYAIQQAFTHKNLTLLQKLVTGEISPLAKKHWIVVNPSEQDVKILLNITGKEILQGLLYGHCCVATDVPGAKLLYQVFEQFIPKPPLTAPPSNLSALGSSTSQAPKGPSSSATKKPPKKDGGCVIC